jgi:hypothetical protein
MHTVKRCRPALPSPWGSVGDCDTVMLTARASRRGRALRGLLALGLALACANGALAQGGLHHGLVYYAGRRGASPQTNALIARRYELGIAGIESRQSTQEIKQLNPAFRWFVYNSVSDNYVNGGNEQPAIEAIAAQHGWDPEIAYLHYYDDTEILSGSDTLHVPGWIGGSAASIDRARLPLYTSSYLKHPRIATHFATPEAQQLQQEVVLALSLDRTFTDTDLYPDGIFFDNSGCMGRKVGDVISGGHVLESPDHAVQAGTSAFATWYWEANLGPFLTAMKDTLETSATWSQDGQRKYLMINVASYWCDSYVTMDVTDYLFLEFQYNPVKSTGVNAIQNVWDRELLAASAGITLFYSPSITTTTNYGGTITFGESLLGGLAWYLTTRTEESLLFIQATGNPNTAGWDTLTWRGCIDVANEQLGHPTSDPYHFVEGTDPTGKPYRVWARDYENGLVLVRNRGLWSEDIEPETAVSVPLPSALSPVSVEGEIGEATTSVMLRNGTAAILLRRVAPGIPRTLPGGAR